MLGVAGMRWTPGGSLLHHLWWKQAIWCLTKALSGTDLGSAGRGLLGQPSVQIRLIEG